MIKDLKTRHKAPMSGTLITLAYFRKILDFSQD